MSDFTNSPEMSMPVPNVGEAPGPEWASLLNACLAILDSHTHAPGSGVPITTDAISITADLSFNSFNATDFRSTRYTAQASPIGDPADIGCLYVSGVDLYYNDINGNQIRITNNGSISGTSGSITGLVAPATASYNSISKTFVWQSDVSTPANLDAASVIFRKVTASSPGITVQVPASIASDYSLVWPSIPASEAYVTLDSSGNFLSSTPKNRSYIPVGTMMPIGTGSVPSGWLACDGSAVSRTTYADLFAAIGTTYGAGDTTTTFNVPDLRGVLQNINLVTKVYDSVSPVSAGSILVFTNVEFDTVPGGGYNTSTGQYTAPETGYYKIGGFFQSAQGDWFVQVYIDNAASNYIGYQPTSIGIGGTSTIVFVTAGQTIDVRPANGTAGLQNNSYLTIERIQGPSNDSSGSVAIASPYIIKT